MIEALCKELDLHRSYLNNEPISTIYFGGGTPSILEKNHLLKILDTIRNLHEIIIDAEITLEANPDDISIPALNDWRQLGINRLSIGIQSFDDPVLKYMNRVHNANQAMDAFMKARECGFDNLNIDLIYGVLQQDHHRWFSDLEKIEKLKPEHISAYSLTIEQNTVFGRWVKKGRIQPVDEDFAAVEFEMLTRKLNDMGYVHYEVSNFCLQGKESKHNTGYWKNEKYLGIGPGAHSYNTEYRHYNISNNSIYIKSVNNEELPNRIEKLGTSEKINEYLLTTLRTRWGASIDYLKDLGYNILVQHDEYLKELEKSNHLEIRENRIVLTPSGFLLADKITSDLFVETGAL